MSIMEYIGRHIVFLQKQVVSALIGICAMTVLTLQRDLPTVCLCYNVTDLDFLVECRDPCWLFAMYQLSGVAWWCNVLGIAFVTIL